MIKSILKKVAAGKLSPLDAYKLMYEPRPRPGRFVKLSMIIKDHPMVSSFVNVLFFLPIPIALGKPFIEKGFKKADISPDLYKIIKKYSGGTKIKVKTEEAKVKIMIL